MKVKLIKQKYNNKIAYKILETNYCCKAIKNIPIIDVFNEKDSFDNDDDFIPSVMINETISEYHDDLNWIEDHYYRIKYCPFCGAKIELNLEKEEDVSENFNKLIKERDKLKKWCNIDKNAVLQLAEVNEKIKRFLYTLDISAKLEER